MNVLIRADASVATGHGHVMRCLTLAEDLRADHAQVSFACRIQPGDLCDRIEARGFEVARFAVESGSWREDAEHTRVALDAAGRGVDWLIVDHYQLDARWERALAPAAHAVMVIDDLADRPHACDLLLDQNYFPNAANRYEKLLPVWSSRLLGAEFVLLRAEFRSAKLQCTARGAPRLLIFFGGGDPTGQSGIALAAAMEFDATLPVDVIVGSNNPRAAAIENEYAQRPNVRVLRQTGDMAKLMSNATLSLGAGGIATFERLYMDLPSLVISSATNQREPLEALAALGCIEYLGEAEKVGEREWVAALRNWFARPRRPPPLAVATRTSQVLDSLQTQIVSFAEQHIATTFEFLQDEELRANFAMSDAPRWERHLEYWRARIATVDEPVFAIMRRGRHAGNCGLKRMGDGEDYEAWIYLAPGLPKRAGLGEFAFRRLMRHAFRDLALTRLYLHVRRDNLAALRLYEKIGFRVASEPVDGRVWRERSDQMCKLEIER